MFLTFWILYSYLVPISLFVTMELVKFWQVRRGRPPDPSELRCMHSSGMLVDASA